MNRTPEELAELRKKHDAYIERVKANGGKVITFQSVCCNKPIETPAAPPGEKWDTLATCQHCGSIYMKITKGDKVDALDY